MNDTALEHELLRRDVHPAELLMPDGQVLTGLRVFVTTRRLLAYKADPHGRIEKALELELADPCTVPADRGTLPANGRLEARLQDGSTAWVNRGAGCGCGSPLKALAPPVPWVRR